MSAGRSKCRLRTSIVSGASTAGEAILKDCPTAARVAMSFCPWAPWQRDFLLPTERRRYSATRIAVRPTALGLLGRAALPLVEALSVYVFGDTGHGIVVLSFALQNAIRRYFCPRNGNLTCLPEKTSRQPICERLERSIVITILWARRSRFFIRPAKGYLPLTGWHQSIRG